MLLTYPYIDVDFGYLQRTVEVSSLLVHWIGREITVEHLDCSPENEKFLLPLRRRLNAEEAQRCAEWLREIGGHLAESYSYKVQIAVLAKEEDKFKFMLWWG
jgi:hypothetical protein